MKKLEIHQRAFVPYYIDSPEELLHNAHPVVWLYMTGRWDLCSESRKCSEEDDEEGSPLGWPLEEDPTAWEGLRRNMIAARSKYDHDWAMAPSLPKTAEDMYDMMLTLVYLLLKDQLTWPMSPVNYLLFDDALKSTIPYDLPGRYQPAAAPRGSYFLNAKRATTLGERAYESLLVNTATTAIDWLWSAIWMRPMLVYVPPASLADYSIITTTNWRVKARLDFALNGLWFPEGEEKVELKYKRLLESDSK